MRRYKEKSNLSNRKLREKVYKLTDKSKLCHGTTTILPSTKITRKETQTRILRILL